PTGDRRSSSSGLGLKGPSRGNSWGLWTTTQWIVRTGRCDRPGKPPTGNQRAVFPPHRRSGTGVPVGRGGRSRFAGTRSPGRRDGLGSAGRLVRFAGSPSGSRAGRSTITARPLGRLLRGAFAVSPTVGAAHRTAAQRHAATANVLGRLPRGPSSGPADPPAGRSRSCAVRTCVIARENVRR